MTSHIVTLAGSSRSGSINRNLAEIAADIAINRGANATHLDLADYPMPLYDGDLEARDGVPAEAHALEQVLASADGIFIASPEYNGGFTPLLKNTIDWVTRVDYSAWAKPIAIASATPGKGGGANGLRVLEALLENMRIQVVSSLAVPNARESLSGTVDPTVMRGIEQSIDALIGATRPMIAV